MNELKGITMKMRKRIFKIVTRAKSGHLGASFSCIDILCVLYWKILKISPQLHNHPDRDRFILSKGHACSALYAVLEERCFFNDDLLTSYTSDGTIFAAHPCTLIPGIELSTGSLGHGFSVAAGMALAAKHDNKDYRVFVLLSDGECNEGSNWEAALFASHHNLDNITVIIDYNKIQAYGRTKDVIELEPFVSKWQSFGFETREIDGHNLAEIEKVLSVVPFKTGRPSVVIAHTVKGKGVSFMENTIEWHYLTPTEENLKRALEELDNCL